MVTTRSAATKDPVIFQPISHPILTSVDPAEAAKFRRDREHYEVEIEQKEKDGAPLVPATYRVSICPQLLRSVHRLGYFDTIAPNVSVENLSEMHLEEWIKELADTVDGVEADPDLIHSALAGLRTNTKITDPRARIMQLAIDFDTRLEEKGLSKFIQANTAKATELLTEKLYPPILKSKVKHALEYMTETKNDWKKFVHYVCTQAEHIQKGSSAGNGNTTGGSKLRSSPNATTNNGYMKGETKPFNSKTQMRPKCLNPDCTERHLLRYCRNTSVEKKRELHQKFQDEKARKGSSGSIYAVKGGTMSVPSLERNDNSTNFVATFADKVQSIICTDIGSDINLLCPSLFKSIERLGNDTLKVEILSTPIKFDLAVQQDSSGNRIYVECDRKVKINIKLHVRHGSSLTLRNVTWYVALKPLQQQLLGRKCLEALGMDAKQILTAACERHCGNVDISELVDEDNPNNSYGSVKKLGNSCGFFHSTGPEADYESSEDLPLLELGIDTSQEIDTALNMMVQDAKIAGLSDVKRLKNLLLQYKDVFRCRLGNDPPAMLEPMKIVLKAGAVPFRAKPRRYSIEQRMFIINFIRQAEEFGFVRKNPHAQWVSAPLLVAKAGPSKFRITFDLRAINAATVPMTWPMPHIESELADMNGCSVFAIIDFVSGYWQLPLEGGSQEYHSILTPIGIYSSTRTLQGGRNGVANFQATVVPCFDSLSSHLKAWLDDFLIHTHSEREHLDVLEAFFKICRQYRLKISAKKSTLYATKVKWCGRIIDNEGVKFDPSRISGLADMEQPVTAGELCEFIHCMQWMACSVPAFAERIEPLRKILEKAFERTGQRTHRSVRNMALSTLSWGPKENNSFLELQESLRNAVKLAHIRDDMEVCIYTDASDQHWAAVVTQCALEDLDKDLTEQKHQPLAFISSSFKGAEMNWSTFEKEAFAIYQTFQKLDYMFASRIPHVYTDHRNLLFIFNPCSLEPALGRHVVSKVQRWALYLSSFQYTIEHVSGNKNVFADILTRWLKGYRRNTDRTSVKAVRSIVQATQMMESPLSRDFDWPDKERVKEVQLKHSSTQNKIGFTYQDGMLYKDGKIWIPSEAAELQMQILVAGHCGLKGHRGIDATWHSIMKEFVWSGIRKDVEIFVRKCLHCISSRAGDKIPRPLASTAHASRPNQMLHFDYLYMGPGMEGYKYVLVLSDDFSSYKWLCPSQRADAKHTAKSIRQWIDVFSCMDVWTSDQGSHFRNETMKLLANEHDIRHHFTTTYTPWANGTVERVNREILRAVKALLSELRLAPSDWPTCIPMVQTVLNESTLSWLGRNPGGIYRCPLEVMTALKPNINVLLSSDCENIKALSFDRAKQVILMGQLQETTDQMHKDVEILVSARRKKEIAAHNKKVNLIQPNFCVGDFVLVRKARNSGHKLAYKWQGPKRISDIVSPLVYEVTSLISDEKEKVHASRLHYYHSQLVGAEVSKDLLSYATHTEAHYEIIERILDIKIDRGVFWLKIEWEGLPDADDITWEIMLQIFEDAPETVLAFLQHCKKKIAKKAICTLSSK